MTRQVRLRQERGQWIIEDVATGLYLAGFPTEAARALYLTFADQRGWQVVP